MGAFIAHLRNHLGLSQEELADLCNIHRTYMTRIETGKVNISADKVRIMAHHLGLTVAQFYTLFENTDALQFWESQQTPKPKKPRRSSLIT
ncbi:MAG: helix-turn-helix domain-containing protein [Blastocatellia bacterium]|nr:helix-turn-helix domain-containing protein [Blastocatellia bacterium]